MAGAQFNQNPREFVKLQLLGNHRHLEYSEPPFCPSRADASPMARFSQPTFLNGPPQPLVLTLDGRSECPLDLYKKIASPSRPSFLLESGKRLTDEPSYSFRREHLPRRRSPRPRTIAPPRSVPGRFPSLPLPHPTVPACLRIVPRNPDPAPAS